MIHIITSSTLMVVGSWRLQASSLSSPERSRIRHQLLPLHVPHRVKANDMGAASALGVMLVVIGCGARPAAPETGRKEPQRKPNGRCLMASLTQLPVPPSTPVRPPARPRPRTTGPGRTRPNFLGGFGGWLWLAIIIVPVYYVVVTSLKNQAGFFTSNPMMPPAEPTLDNYKLVWRTTSPVLCQQPHRHSGQRPVPALWCPSWPPTRSSGKSSSQLDEQPVPAGPRDPLRHDHPHLLDDRPRHLYVRYLPDPALHRLRHPDLRADSVHASCGTSPTNSSNQCAWMAAPTGP
jgi:hypothetical protein